jgi:hypothetical protein
MKIPRINTDSKYYVFCVAMTGTTIVIFTVMTFVILVSRGLWCFLGHNAGSMT